MNPTPFLKDSPESPRAKASLRAWKGNIPRPGSSTSRTMAFGSLAATSSISIPPDFETIIAGSPLPRSSVMPRYSSRSMSRASSIRTFLTERPAGPPASDLPRLGGTVGHLAPRHGHPVAGQDGFRLILVDFHG